MRNLVSHQNGHGYCIHCLAPSESLEADHVFPSSWYPDSTPSTVQRWTVPSCPKCNRELGRLEQDLLVRLVLCTDPQSDASAGLAARAFRSMGLDVAVLPSGEKALREKLRQRIRSEFIPHAEATALPGRIPGLGPADDASAEWAIPISWAGLAIIGEKIARGCEFRYRNRRRLVMPPYAVGVAIQQSAEVQEPFGSAGRVIDFGPGCRVRRVFFTEDPATVWYFISVWNAVHFHVRIEREDALAEARLHYRNCDGILPPEGRAMPVSTYLRTLNGPATRS
jgi:hypothetical protein